MMKVTTYRKLVIVEMFVHGKKANLCSVVAVWNHIQIITDGFASQFDNSSRDTRVGHVNNKENNNRLGRADHVLLRRHKFNGAVCEFRPREPIYLLSGFRVPIVK